MIWLPIGLCGVMVFGLFIDWIDRRALRVGINEALPARWVLWAKKEAFNPPGGSYFYYILVIRLPSYAWGYSIANDSMRWMQWSLVWTNRRRSKYGPNGLCLWQFETFDRENRT